ncbi:venom phosphodiesterase 2-like [Acanthaster planci]|uniref:Venom phosphodiesterase 2-like n=1 Tax=Acanthaster planci TaxID=133434 RepID=A0A8B7ZH89_ACAPL|nr:venom phosphodiesterase 2-like [Acanthaster planci]
MTTEMQLQYDLEEDQKKHMFKRDATRMFIYIGVAVSLIILCGLGIGLGVGYAIWNGSGVPRPPSPTHSSPMPPTGKPVPETTAKPADHWIDTPCVTGYDPICPPGVDRPPLLLVSLDGFRADYLRRKLTKHIKRLSDCGTHAPYMLPSFPSVTFPNHYTIATGLYPEHNGLIGNSMYDPDTKKSYYIGSAEAGKKEWYYGEPIWNTAKKNGLRTGCYFWVGSDVDIQDMRPDYFFVYTNNITPEQKIDTIRGWLQLPTGKRPDFITLYFNEPDHEAHIFGPNSQQVNDKLEEVDKYIADLMDAILATKMHQCINIIILADHGMADRNCSHYIKLADKNGINFPTSEYYGRSTAGCMMRYTPRTNAALKEPRDIVNRLMCRDPKVIPYVKTDMPKRWHYMNSRRIEDVLIPVKEEYAITNVNLPSNCDGGGHGYDNLARQMQALFLAYGPAFKKNLKIEPFQNIELFNVMCDVLGIPAPVNDGENGRLHKILENPPPLPPIDESSYSSSLTCPYPATDHDYTDRLNMDQSMCTCTDKVANITSKTIKEFDEQLHLSESEVTTAKTKHALFGVPKVTFKTDFCELVQTDYITAYSHELKMPLYTSFTIEKKVSRDTAPDLKCVRTDVRVRANVTPNCTNYDNIQAPDTAVDVDPRNITMGFSYSPGLTETLDAKMDALITSNLVPQFSGFIRDVWSGYLDDYLPKWADQYNGVNIVTGPIFDYDLDGLRDSMEVLNRTGEKLGDTMIPTHYFAIITRCSSTDSQPINKDCSSLIPLAFILHNKDGIQACQGQSDYMETNTATIKDVELLTGLRFYPALERYKAIHLRTYNVLREEFFEYWDGN